MTASDLGTYIEFDVTAPVMLQISDPTQCYGFMLMSTETISDLAAQCRTADDTDDSVRPKLVIEF